MLLNFRQMPMLSQYTGCLNTRILQHILLKMGGLLLLEFKLLFHTPIYLFETTLLLEHGIFLLQTFSYHTTFLFCRH
jgi:hypothetical protein